MTFNLIIFEYKGIIIEIDFSDGILIKIKFVGHDINTFRYFSFNNKTGHRYTRDDPNHRINYRGCCYKESNSSNNAFGYILTYYSKNPYNGASDPTRLEVDDNTSKRIDMALTPKIERMYDAAIIQHQRVTELISFAINALRTVNPQQAKKLEENENYIKMMNLFDVEVKPDIKNHIEEIFKTYNLQQSGLDLPTEPLKRERIPEQPQA